MSTLPIPVIVVEDDDSYRRFLRRLLAGSGRYQCIGAWGSAEAALEALSTLEPTPRVILLDVALPGLPGYAATPRLRERLPDTLVVMLTGIGQDDVVFEALRAGATGYLLKTETPEAILAALDEALAGGAPMTPAIARRVVASFTQRLPQPVPTVESPGAADLTPREHEVLDALVAGLSYKEIAAQLGVSPATVKNHLGNIYSKLHVRTRAEATAKWLRPGGTA